MQPNLLDYIESQRLRDTGMALAAVKGADWLGNARSVAQMLAMKNGEVTINDIYGVIGLPDNANAAGSVFKGKHWQCVGITQSGRVKRHAGTIRRWVLK
jgi:hypothetical protein